MKRLTNRLSCGCLHELGGTERWVKMCDRHEYEWVEVHNRWTDERFGRAGTISPDATSNRVEGAPQ